MSGQPRSERTRRDPLLRSPFGEGGPGPGRRPGLGIAPPGLCLFLAGLGPAVVNAAGAGVTEVAAIHLECAGVLVIEAEDYASKSDSTYARYAQVHSWQVQESASAGGGRFMEVLPDERGEDGEGPPSPRDTSGAALTYRVRITHPGRYYVFVRGMCKGGESNGVHVGINGVLEGRGPGASNLSGFRPREQWQWENGRKEGFESPASLELAAGDHVVNIWSRDDGFKFDRIALTLAAERPVGLGPEPSATQAETAAGSRAPAVERTTGQRGGECEEAVEQVNGEKGSKES